MPHGRLHCCSFLLGSALSTRYCIVLIMSVSPSAHHCRTSDSSQSLLLFAPSSPWFAHSRHSATIFLLFAHGSSRSFAPSPSLACYAFSTQRVLRPFLGERHVLLVTKLPFGNALTRETWFRRRRTSPERQAPRDPPVAERNGVSRIRALPNWSLVTSGFQPGAVGQRGSRPSSKSM